VNGDAGASVSRADSWISDDMRALVGRPFNVIRSYPVSVSDIRKWAIAVHYPEVPPRLYWDEEYACSTVFAGIVAPEDFNPFAWISAEPGVRARRAGFDPDYLERGFGIAGPGLTTNLNAGLSTRYGERMRPGDVISGRSEVVSYTEKSGRMGRMLITVIRSVWTNQNGVVVKTTDQTSIRY
jgi:N-terminal half of MaoC dehydratase